MIVGYFPAKVGRRPIHIWSPELEQSSVRDSPAPSFALVLGFFIAQFLLSVNTKNGVHYSTP